MAFGAAFGGAPAYGAPAANPFAKAAAPPAANPFAAPAAAAPAPFGAPPAVATGGFGGFGAPAATAGYGAPAANPFGAPAAPAAPASNPFGAPAATAGSSFGDRPVQLEQAGQSIDTISSISWAPSGRFLCTAGWDAKVRVFQLNAMPPAANAGATYKGAQNSIGAPVLDAKWLAEDQLVFCGLNRQVQIWNVTANSLTAVGIHDAGVRNVVPIPEMGAVVSAGFDKALRVFDVRTPRCVHVVPLASTVMSMDAALDLVVVAGGQIEASSNKAYNRRAGAIELFNMRMLPRPERQFESPLKFQSRVVKVFPDASSFVLGSVEGRCTFRLRDAARDGVKDAGGFNFRCHRDTHNNAYCVNAIDTQPNTGGAPGPGRSRPFSDVFITGGSNGSITLWDRGLRKRVSEQWPGRPQTPISALKFDPTGYYLAYAHGYDWSKGSLGRKEHMAEWGPQATSLHIHNVTEDDMTPRR
ncbi:hypothetical protein FNF29_05645 [Cafeteria roenbergensis]|uniref:Uncharacterized protein n=1 Tax=Cafeteria roenbergensis TaxID=33653 RepID=A0A5A8CB18_CAFRO|nr:hypothetical protein FNF29_05645 [Cafeteria roenbergensis]|eukprot:KAA0149819.1 hypothetical protein FNF29_05645 [Cafeteria roenbergensis]